MMKSFRPSPLLLKNIAYTTLLVATAVLLYLASARYTMQWDFTQSQLNSLEPSSQEILKLLPGQVKITVYAHEQDAQQADLRRLVREFIAIYQRYKHDITLTFIDPVSEPDAVRSAAIQHNGEMVVEYAGRSVHLTTLNEQILSSALLGLAHAKEELLMYLDGHGERKLDGAANYDLGDFGSKLKQNGYHIRSLNLTLAKDVPINASVLVLTHPQVPLMKGEVDKILRHIRDGGDLLWFIDNEPLRGLEPVADELGLMLTPGTLIDPAAQEMNAPANWALSSGYPPHPVTRNFNLITAFPFARAIGHEESNPTWQWEPLVEAAPNGWVSHQPFNPSGKLRFDRNRDVPGPVNLALAAQRNINGKEQRIIVVGGASFLANAYVGNGGNMDLGINMINWLTNEESLITIQPRANKDGLVTLSTHQLSFLSIGLVIVLPLLLLLVGGLQWWRRRG